MSDRNRIRETARYLAGRQDGWTEALIGRTAGLVERRFFKRSKFILKVPAEDINALVRILGVDVWRLPQ